MTQVPAQDIRRMIAVVREEHDVAVARRTAQGLADKLGFRRVAAYEIATSVSELAHNLWVHSTAGGELVLDAVYCEGAVGIQITAQDKGPGIADIESAMRDGYSTKGGLGSGLPGVHRLMDDFELASSLTTGTRVIARKWRKC